MSRRIAGLGIGALVGGLLVAPVSAAGAAKTLGVGPRTPAPAVEVTTLGGRTISLASLKGKVVIVDFWATWCPPCREEIPHFVELYKTYAPQLEILGLAMDEEGAEVVTPFVEKHGVRYPVALSTEALADAFGGVRGLPTTFVIDPEGRIVKKYLGYQPPEGFEQDVRALLPNP